MAGCTKRSRSRHIEDLGPPESGAVQRVRTAGPLYAYIPRYTTGAARETSNRLAPASPWVDYLHDLSVIGLSVSNAANAALENVLRKSQP